MEPTNETLMMTSSAGSSNRQPSLMEPLLKEKLSHFAAGVERSVGGGLEIPSDHAPTTIERGLLETRRTALMAGLASAETGMVKRRIAKLFGMFAVGGMDAETSDGLVEDYARLLASQPLWAIDHACMVSLRSGEKFRPSAPELLRSAKMACDGERRELETLTRVLTAKVYQIGTPEMRDRVQIKFAELCDRMSSKRGPRGQTREMYEDRAMTLAEVSRTSPLVASELLLRSLAEKG